MGNEVNAAISAALPLIESLFSLGLPGIILMLAAIPALVIAVVLILDHRHGKRTEMLLEAYRNDTQEVLRAVSEKHEAILRDMSDKHEETAEFYRKNVTLVKNYEKMNDILQTLVVNNTRVMERLTVVIETRNKA
ncbi:transcriptional regulator [uncultured Desulfovibrio sp.]|uniref:transcriptional regulator n=1 Tax=uncultured Desulfovibrio sp. TaxID=167968 RepID=UPI00260D2364|nr:transcriptional regulator [uncultured Desulfovibrio sp.]